MLLLVLPKIYPNFLKIFENFLEKSLGRDYVRTLWRKKTIREPTRKDLEVNKLDSNLVYDKALWRNLIHVGDPI